MLSLGKLFDLDARPGTPEELAAEKDILARGTFAPEVISQGTMAFAFTFDTGFKLVWINSAGPVTDGDRALARKLGPVDIAIIAYQGHPVAETQVPFTLELVKLFRPRIYLPARHDETFGYWLDLGVEPLFEAIQDALRGNPNNRAASQASDVLRHPKVNAMRFYNAPTVEVAFGSKAERLTASKSRPQYPDDQTNIATPRLFSLGPWH